MTSPKLQKSPVTKNSSNKPRLHLVRRKDRAILYSLTSWSAPFTFSELNKSRAFISVEYYSDPNEYSQYSLEDLCKIQEDDILSSEKYLATWWGNTFPAIDNDAFAVQSFYVNELLDLAPFLASVRIKPDLCVVNNGIPILWIDIFSRSAYKDTIAHCVLGLITQFPLFKAF